MTIPGTAKQLRTAFPELWKGPSFLITLVVESKVKYFASGYFLRLGLWESPESGILQEALNELGEIKQELISSIQKCTSVLIEVDDDRSPETTELSERFLSLGLNSSQPTVKFRASIPDFNAVSATATKLPQLGEPFLGGQLLDLTATALPNRHGSTDFPLAFAQRRCRLIMSQRVSFAVWEPLEKQDQLNWSVAQRWPHHCIPSFSEMYERTTLFEGIDGAEALGMALIERILRNEIYFLGHLERELEFTEGHLFEAMYQESGSVPPGFSEAVDQLANLERYLRMARSSATRLRRRIEVSSLRLCFGVTAPTLRSTFDEGLGHLDALLVSIRSALRGSLEVLTTTTDVVRLRQELEQQRKTERFREIASAAAVVFSILSLVISGYGANLRELSPGARGSVSAIFVISLSVIVTVGLFYIVRYLTRHHRVLGRNQKKQPD